MSVVSLTQVSAKLTTDANGYDTYSVRLRVTTDSRADGPATVKAYASLPGVGDTYEYSGEADSSALFTGREVDLEKEDETLKLWKVMVQYSNDPGKASKRDPEEPPALPWDEPPKMSLVTSKGEKAVFLDKLNQMIASSAGEPFDPVARIKETNYMLRVTRNVLTCDPGFNAIYRDAINDDVFLGFPRLHVYVETPGAADILYFAGQKYYAETWEFALSNDPWDLELLDYGYRRKVGVGAAAKYVPIKGLDGSPLQSPTLLDGAGGVLNLAAGAAPVKVSFRVYNPRPLAPIGIGNTF